jgi:hypothetical protein
MAWRIKAALLAVPSVHHTLLHECSHFLLLFLCFGKLMLTPQILVTKPDHLGTPWFLSIFAIQQRRSTNESQLFH